MTIPAIFYATSHKVSAFVGFAAAVVLSYMEKSLVTVAALSCTAVIIAEVVIKYVI